MVTYMLLLKADPHGSERVLESGSGARQQAERVFDAIGGRLKDYFFVTGQFDVVIIAEFEEGAEALLLSHLWSAVGLYPEAVLRAFEADEMDPAIESVARKLGPLLEESKKQSGEQQDNDQQGGVS